jgi:HSP20 family protein
MNQLHGEINRLFDDSLGRYGGDDASVVTTDWVPSVDIKEEDERFVLHADIPGVDPKDIDVTMDNGILTIRGERKSETQENRDGYHRV